MDMKETVRTLVLQNETEDVLSEDSVQKVARYYELCDYMAGNLVEADVYALYYFDKLMEAEKI